jgi:elongation factor P
MLTTSDFKKGVRVEMDGAPYTIVSLKSQSPSARGAATLVKVRLRNVLTGQIMDRTFKSGDKFVEPDIQFREAQFLYSAPDGDTTTYHFMDNSNYEQFEQTAEALDDQAKWLVDDMSVRAVLYNNQVCGIELPQFVEMELETVEPGSKGDTASGGVTTTGTTTTGVRVQVPLYMRPGDRIRIDTGTGTFKERVGK